MTSNEQILYPKHNSQYKCSKVSIKEIKITPTSKVRGWIKVMRRLITHLLTLNNPIIILLLEKPMAKVIYSNKISLNKLNTLPISLNQAKISNKELHLLTQIRFTCLNLGNLETMSFLINLMLSVCRQCPSEIFLRKINKWWMKNNILAIWYRMKENALIISTS